VRGWALDRRGVGVEPPAAVLSYPMASSRVACSFDVPLGQLFEVVARAADRGPQPFLRAETRFCGSSSGDEQVERFDGWISTS